MEILAAVLSGLLGVAGAPGIIIDRVIADFLRSQLVSADQLEVRVDNTPNYQLLDGKIDRVRVAGRGLYVSSFRLRVDTVDLETDPISIEPSSLQSGKLNLREPAQAAVRVVLRSEDLNQALRSPTLLPLFRGIKINLTPNDPSKTEEFNIANPEITFLNGNRLRLNATLQPVATTKPGLNIAIESSLNVVDGTRIELSPKINLQGVSVPEQITNPLAQSLNKLLDIRQLEASGITARVLQLKVTDSQLQLIGFVRMEVQK